MLQYYVIMGNESYPNVSVLILINETQGVVPLTYELNVYSSDGCVLQECPMLLNPGQKTLTVTLMDGEDYNATLVVSNDCGSDSTTIPIQPEGKDGIHCIVPLMESRETVLHNQLLI